VIAFVSSLTLLAGAAQAQHAVATAHATVRDLGKRFDSEVLGATAAAYTALQRGAARDGVRVVADVAYGPAALQAMDLYVPEASAAEPMPIVVYFHGGGLVAGNKDSAGTEGLIYGNIGTFFARQGMIGVNANYRLVPDVEWPGGPEDVRAIVQWLKAHANEYGGDPNRIFLMGNSAGSTHVAAYLFHQPSQIDNRPGVIGALLGSGGFGPGGADTMRAYIGSNEADWIANSPLGLVDSYAGELVPIFMWSAEYDPARIETRVAQMYAKLCVKYEDCPRYIQYQGHNHVSPVMSMNSADQTLAHDALDFIQGVLDASKSGAH
jgi:triacylglycerol lipase